MHNDTSNVAGFAYLVAVVGAAVYFIQQAHSFGDGVLGVLKALVWPGVLVYEGLKLLHH
ncbi:MAG TPA: hypothetical protein VM674_00370 [Candidatus Acidoferrum sp.]|nr:hypothetical protein [Candidatus Acidoferrum sp.]